MYAQAFFCVMALATGILANLLTSKAKSVPSDADSIGTQERYYKAWLMPVYLWCVHHALAIAFICVVMNTLYLAGSEIDGQTE